MTVFLSLALTFTAAISSSQTLYGTVTDFFTRQPISGAVVSIGTASCVDVDSTVTGLGGHFAFDMIWVSVQWQLKTIWGVCVPTGVESVEAIHGFEISQAFPNPFNPSVSLQISSPAGGVVLAEVYDILGRLIIRSNLEMRQGTGVVNIERIGSAGVYFAKITFNGKATIRKLVLLDGQRSPGSPTIQISQTSLQPERTSFSKLQETWFLWIKHPGYAPGVVEVATISETNVSLAPVDLITITGRTRDNRLSNPLPAVRVSLLTSDSIHIASTDTDSSGFYFFQFDSTALSLNSPFRISFQRSVTKEATH